MKLYHYTTGHKLPQIQLENRIRPSRDGILWLSSNPVYEYSALKPVNGRLSLELLRSSVGLYRFHVEEEAAHPWATVRHENHFGLNSVGRRMGANPLEWYCLFQGVPPKNLEYFNPWGKWVPETLEEAVKKFHSLGVNVESRYIA